MRKFWKNEVINVAKSVLPDCSPSDDDWPDTMDRVAVEVLDKTGIDLSFDEVNELMEYCVQGENNE